MKQTMSIIMYYQKVNKTAKSYRNLYYQY